MFTDFLEALRFLTIFPVPAAKKKANDLARAMFFFPLVGFLIGLATLWVFSSASSIFPEGVANLLLVFVPVVLSGGLHLDGFADFCDGFFGPRDKTEILKIMKDPHIGTWGAAGIFFLLLVKYELLRIFPDKAPPLLFALTASRWSQVILSYCLPYAGLEGGLGKRVAQKIQLRELLGATFFLFLVTLWLQWVGLFVFVGLAIFLAPLGYFYKRRLGGITGDLLGAASEMSEAVVLLFLAVLTNSPLS